MNYYIENILINMALVTAPVVIAVLVHNIFRVMFAKSIFNASPSRNIYYFFSFFFTPIHELSHLVVAILFFHKIDKVVLFQKNKSGTLGYVNHRWNSRSIYQSTGTFFIAIAPLIASVLITFYILDSSEININSLGFNFSSVILVLEKLSIVEILFISLIGFYCTPSNSDFKSSLAGLGYLGNLLVLGTLISVIGFNTSSISLIAKFSLGMTGVVCIFSTLFWIVLFVISLAFKPKVEPN